MPTEPTDFRDRLLDAQQITPGLREEYRKELNNVLNCRLTRRTRAATVGGIIVSLVLTALCVRSLVSVHAKIDAKIVAAAVAAASVMGALWFARVLWQGGFARRASFAVTEALGSIVVGGVLSVTLLRGMSAPSDPASTFWALWGLMVLIVGFAWATGNRIAAAALETRERMLRIESRLADLAERPVK